jgi:undecaprenyl-diphosphatase
LERKNRKTKKTPRRNLLAWDRHWMRRSGRIEVPLWLHRVLVTFVRSGDGWGWVLVCVALFLLLRAEDVVFLMGQAAVALMLSLPLYWILKATIRRARPFVLFKSVAARVPPLDTYSFPSGHTMNNMAIAASMALHLPWLWPVALLMPLSLGLLRVLYGVHFVTDIVGGALIGFVVALVAYFLYGWLPLSRLF